MVWKSGMVLNTGNQNSGNEIHEPQHAEESGFNTT